MSLWDILIGRHETKKEEQPLASNNLPQDWAQQALNGTYTGTATNTPSTSTNIPYVVTGGGTVGTLGGAGQYYPFAAQQQVAGLAGTYYSLPVLPQLTGSRVNMCFTDASGQQLFLIVDQAYFSILSQISASHQSPFVLTQAIVMSEVMSEGEFSLDEMDKAEQLISELEHAEG